MLFYSLIGILQLIALAFQVASYARLMDVGCSPASKVYVIPLLGAILNAVSMMLCAMYFGCARKKSYDPVDAPVRKSALAIALRSSWILLLLLSYACAAAAFSDVMNQDYLCVELASPDYFAGTAFMLLTLLIPLAHVK